MIIHKSKSIYGTMNIGIESQQDIFEFRQQRISDLDRAANMCTVFRLANLYANRIFMYFCIKSSIGTQGEVS